MWKEIQVPYWKDIQVSSRFQRKPYVTIVRVEFNEWKPPGRGLETNLGARRRQRRHSRREISRKRRTWQRVHRPRRLAKEDDLEAEMAEGLEDKAG